MKNLMALDKISKHKPFADTFFLNIKITVYGICVIFAITAQMLMLKLIWQLLAIHLTTKLIVNCSS